MSVAVGSSDSCGHGSQAGRLVGVRELLDFGAMKLIPVVNILNGGGGGGGPSEPTNNINYVLALGIIRP